MIETFIVASITWLVITAGLAHTWRPENSMLVTQSLVVQQYVFASY